MNIEKINQEVLNEEEIVEDVNSEDYQKMLDEEQEAFESGIVDDELDIEMNEDEVNNQTMEFLKLHGKAKK